MKAAAPAKWGASVEAKPIGGQPTRSGHFYRYQRGLDIYVWVEGMDGRPVCGRVRISRKDVESYVKQARARRKKS